MNSKKQLKKGPAKRPASKKTARTKSIKPDSITQPDNQPATPYQFPAARMITTNEIKQAANEFPAISDIKKRTMLVALCYNLGIVATAAIAAGIHRDTHYDWMNTDAKYKQAVKSIKNLCLDFSESALFKNIAAGDTTAIIYHLNCHGGPRGYRQKQTIQFTNTDDDEIDSTLDF